MDYITRPATDADYQYCYRLTKRNMFTLITRHWGGWIPSMFRQDFSVEATTIVIASGQRMGYYSVKEDEESLYLENIQLSSSVRGRGIGTAILQSIFRENASKPIRLTTFTDNPAMRLYERLGFVVTQCEGATVHMIRCTE